MILPQEVCLVDATSRLHPFYMHQLDVGPIRLTTIAHAFNYQVAVLRDGVKTLIKRWLDTDDNSDTVCI